MGLKSYICICGKTFDKSQSYVGHRRHCKIGKTSEQIQGIEKADKLIGIQRNKYRSALCRQKQENADAQWLQEQHICEWCGKPLLNKFASGRFCSQSCANKYNASLSKQSGESYKTFKYGHGKSPYEQYIYARLKQLPFKFIWNATRPQYTNIKGHTYVLDFYFPEYHVALEYDGRLHKDRETYDIQRDAYLKSLGIVIYRIKDYDTNKTLDELFDEFLIWFKRNYIEGWYNGSTGVFDTPSVGSIPIPSANL